MRIIACLIAVALFSGCASNKMYYLQGRSQAELSAASEQCHRETAYLYDSANAGLPKSAPGAVGALAALTAVAFAGTAAAAGYEHDNCMSKYGFRRAK